MTELLRAGYIRIVDADRKSYFDTIPYAPMIGQVEEKISEGTVLEVVRAGMKQDIMDIMDAWTPEEGTPQGAGIVLCCEYLFLHYVFDKWMKSPA